VPGISLPRRCHPRQAQVFERAVHHGLQLPRVFYFPAFGEIDASFFGVKPFGIAEIFFGTTRLSNFHQEGLHDVFLHATRLPENALGVQVDMEVPRLNHADGACLFARFAFCSLAMRKTSVGGSLGKRPLAAAVRVDQQEFRMGILPPVTHCRDLERKREPG